MQQNRAVRGCVQNFLLSLFHEMRRISMKDQIKQDGHCPYSQKTDFFFSFTWFLWALSSKTLWTRISDPRTWKIYHWQTETLRTQENMQLVKQRLRQIISKEQKNQLRNKTVKQKNCETRQMSNWSRQEHFSTHHKPVLLTETNKR